MRRASVLPNPPPSLRGPLSPSPAQLHRLVKRRMTLPAHGLSGDGSPCVPGGRCASDTINANTLFTPPTNIIITLDRSLDNEVFSGCDVTDFDMSDSLIRAENDDRTQIMIENLRSKINHLFNQIQIEQTALEDNVDGYLSACSTADKDQLCAIKMNFEKNNQKLSASVTRLRRKVILYEKRLALLEQTGVLVKRRRSSKRMLRNVGHGIKNFASKPIELAQHLKQKFSSESNAQTNDFEGSEVELSRFLSHQESQTNHQDSRNLSTFNHISIERSGGSPNSGGEGEVSRGSSGGSGWEDGSLQDPRIPASIDRLRLQMSGLRMVVTDLRVRCQTEMKERRQMLEVNQEILEGLERQVSDASELFQYQVQNIKQEIGGLEEKMCYMFEERINDLHENIENCLTRVAKLEVQHHHTQQLLLGEGAESSTARFMVTTINIILVLLGFLFVSLQTLSTCVNSCTNTKTVTKAQMS